MSDYFDIEIDFDATHLLLSLRDDDGTLRGAGDIPLTKLKFHMDRAAEGKPYKGWEGETK